MLLSANPILRKTFGPSPRPGWLSEIVFPIRTGDKVAGRFILQYKTPRGFTEADLLIAEMISLHAGAVVHQLQRQRKKDELVAMAVHELRSPLTAILGGTFMLRTGKGASPEDSTAMIERNARVQAKLVEELLHVSQIDTGKLPLQMKVVDLTFRARPRRR